MPTDNLHNVLSMPEIQTKVGRLLTFRELESCQFVCRVWRHVFTPLVWQQRPLSILGAIQHHNDPESLGMLQQYGRYVRHLTLQRVYTLRTIAQYLQNISHLQVHQLLDTDAGQGARWPQLADFMATCPRLESLAICTKLGSRLDQFAPALSRAVGNRLRHLTLHLAQGQAACSTDLITLLLGLPSLLSLQAHLGGSWQLSHDPVLLKDRTFKLRVLELYDHHGRLIQHHGLQALIQDQPSIQPPDPLRCLNN